MSKPFYITTTLPYVNAEPHIGHALEMVQGDIIARYKKLIGDEVFFNTGTDEHGVKIYRKALEEGKDPQAYTDEYAEKFKDLKDILGLSEDIHFIRTTNGEHKEAAQEFWKRCDKNGFIDKKMYKIRYCVGCELEKSDSELDEGKCSLHPNLELEISEEENYFFKFSAFQKKLEALYKERPDFVVPDFRFNEIKAFVQRGLEDFSISRKKEKMPWGIAVPGDEGHVMYVWFDALVNYISTLGWPGDEGSFQKWWIETGGVVQFAGKDQIRQQAAMWQAMLMAAELSPSKQIVIHGFITSEGIKMSKSTGNVVNPLAIVDEYGTDVFRYYLARHIHPFEDSDFTMEKFKESYNADLANGLGNLVSRVMKMAETHLDDPVSIPENTIPDNFKRALDEYNIQGAANIVWDFIGQVDKHIQETEPFKLIKIDKEKAVGVIKGLVVDVYTVARMLNPFMPATMEKIKKLVKTNKAPSEPLFPRKE